MARAPQLAVPRRPVRGERGFTLLELILALSLSVVILMAVTMAVQFHLRTYDSRQIMLEESQLARAILHIVAQDIRSVVVHYEQDISGIETLMQSATAAAATTGLATGGGGESEQQGGGTAAGSGGGGATQGGGGGTELGASGGGEFSGGETGQQTSGVTEEGSTEDLASTAVVPGTPGIYGNQFQLQVDVSRLPRLEEYQQIFAVNPATELVDIASDIKTVSYFVQTQTDAATSASMDAFAAADGTLAYGLVRRQLDRSVTQWAVTNASASSLMSTGDLLASEVVGIEFQYFDGIEWRTEWDTQIEEGLPLAIQIVLAMSTMDPNDPEAQEDATGLNDPNTRYYSLLVSLPVGTASTETESTETESTTGDEL